MSERIQALPAGHEPGTRRLIFAYFVAASLWLVVGTVYGLIAAIKLYWPEAMEIPMLSFGRIRPIHTNIVMFGWSSMALMGLALFVISRTSKRPLYRPKIARIGLWAWNIALLLAVITLSAGISRGPQEYREIV